MRAWLVAGCCCLHKQWQRDWMAAFRGHRACSRTLGHRHRLRADVQLLAAGEDVDIILDKTPFYAESGGQIGDHGQLHTVPESSSNGASTSPPAHASVSDVRKMSGDFFLHRASIQSGRLHVGQQVCVGPGWQ